jgi:hypothetical protein
VRAHDPLIPAEIRGQYGSYSAWLADGLRSSGPGIIVSALRDNLSTCYAIAARSFSLGRNVILDAIAVASVVALLGAGAVAFARRARVTLLFIACYLTIVLAWPFSPLRFVWGIWPLAVLLMVDGSLYLWRLETEPSRRRIARALCVATVTVTLAGALLFNVRGYANAWWATVARSTGPRIEPQLVWVGEHTAASDVIAADDEGAVFLYTGRLAVPTNEFTVAQYVRARTVRENAPQLARIVSAFSPRYVVAWTVPTLDAATVLSQMRPPLLVPVDTIPGGRVFRAVRVTRITDLDSSPQ